MKLVRVAVGRGVEVAADILDRLADLARRAAAGALEHHMLEQMGDAVQPLGLVARAGVGIEADRGRLDARHLAAGDLEAVGKDGELHGMGGLVRGSGAPAATFFALA